MSKDDDGRGELVHVGDIPIDVPGVGRTLTAKRQVRHFTRLNQVTQLVNVRVIVALFAGLTPTIAHAQALPVELSADERRALAVIDPSDRFALFNRCEPIGLLIGVGAGESAVSGQSIPYSGSGVNQAAVQALFESRLRAARLYNSEYSPRENPGPHLSVAVTLADGGNLLVVEFRKRLYDLASGTGVLSTSWSDGRFGGHDDNTLSALSEIMDRFLVDYLRVNESAC